MTKFELTKNAKELCMPIIQDFCIRRIIGEQRFSKLKENAFNGQSFETVDLSEMEIFVFKFLGFEIRPIGKRVNLSPQIQHCYIIWKDAVADINTLLPDPLLSPAQQLFVLTKRAQINEASATEA